MSVMMVRGSKCHATTRPVVLTSVSKKNGLLDNITKTAKHGLEDAVA